MPADAPYSKAHVSQLPTPAGADPGEAAWRAVRMHFGIGSFGVSAYLAEKAGEAVVPEHDEIDTRHEELFFVGSGHAVVSVAGGEIDAPAGTLVYVRDPGLTRTARAIEPGTTVLAVGGEPGKVFEVSSWERKHIVDG
ncbi:MAG TPA: hypothetical protein VK915_11715 [Gaiellaceae bacterium]|nr:hypothetical protein [Gaiellaceae bacterium]